MYSTCIFCKNSLGANEAIERFPIGRRLAFDAAKGRLWVVCRECERWNLTPLETRWEAIEECERSFRGTKLRTSTDQIGLARLSEGLELVRIGKPLRPEFAAWRYGDQFGTRRRRAILETGAVAAAAGAVVVLGPVMGLSLGAGGVGLVHVFNFSTFMYKATKVVTRIPAPDGRLLPVRYSEADSAVMLPPKGGRPWGLRVGHRTDRSHVAWWRYSAESETTDIHGDDAVRAAAQLLPRLNRRGASERLVKEAVALAASNPDPLGSFSDAAHLAVRQWSWKDLAAGTGGKLAKLPAELRLSLEMISHEDSERRAMEGELYVLEEAWKEAEEIAGISDNLFLPAEVSAQLADLKRDAR